MKQAIVARADLGMGRGKLVTQVAHASLSTYEDTDLQTRKRWKGGGQKKVVLKANGESKPFKLADEVKRADIPHAIIRDVEHAQLDPGTVTVLAVGLAKDDEIDRVTGDLSLY